MMQYKDYIGRVEYDDEADIFHGEVINTRDVITFQGQSVAELKKAFRASVDDYLAFCAQRCEEPDKPFSGQFLTRLSPELHRQVNLAASRSGKSLNAWVSEQLQSAVERAAPPVGRSPATSRGRPSQSARGGWFVIERRHNLTIWTPRSPRAMGINDTRLTYRFQGRDFRLTDVHGEVVGGLLA